MSGKLHYSVSPGAPAQRAPRGAVKRRPNLESRTLNSVADISGLPVPVRGQWLRPDHVGLRNAAWGVRNARWAGQDENKMIAWLCREVKQVLEAGEPIESVVPSLVDLFLRP